MHRDHRLYLDDMIESIVRILEYTADMDEPAFSVDRKTQDAVVRNLEIVGEAASKLPGGVRDAAPEIEWRKITGLRNVLIHEYFGVNLPIIWDVVQNKLESLERACRMLLENSRQRGERS